MTWNKFIEIFQTPEGRLSSKRVFGGIGFLTSLIMCFTGVGIETIALIVGTSAAMLGLDSVTGIWKK
jgi:hypothetical protein